MPRNYFETLPVIQYDINDTGNIKLASNILTRIRRKANFIVNGSIFYNYPMQEGDTPEIIADKYYGDSSYHWVIMLVNDAYHNIYDFPLTSENFNKYIDDTYGSFARAVGVSKLITDMGVFPNATITSEDYNEVQTSDNNTALVSGTIPAGKTTAIKLTGSSNPFTIIDVGDTVELLVPSYWHDIKSSESAKLGYTQPATVLAKSTRSDGYVISTNMDSSRYPIFTWTPDHYLRVETGVTVDPIATDTANQTHVWLDTSTQNDLYASNGFITFSGTPYSDVNETTFKIQNYNHAFTILELDDTTILPVTFEAGWAYTITYGKDFTSGDILIKGDDITLHSGIHHFEMDVYSDDGTLLLGDHRITKNQYVDTTIGTASTKRIVSNFDYEVREQEKKRNIILLKKELLNQFVSEFQYLLRTVQ